MRQARIRRTKGRNVTEDVEVEIFGQTFRLAAGAAESDYMQRLAAHVDERIRAIADVSPSVSFNRLAILTALNIADDLFKLQEDLDHASQLMDAKTDRLIAAIKQQLTTN